MFVSVFMLRIQERWEVMVRAGGGGARGAVETVYSKSTNPVNRLQHVALQTVTPAPKGEVQNDKLHTWPRCSLKCITRKLLRMGLRTSG